MTGIEVFLEVLSASGIRTIFGNPGTTELPLNAALAGDSRFRYVFGLHEIPVMAMADGFAMATGEVAVVNLHAACGLGNAMGMLYNAYIEGTPLLVTAGQQDRRLRFAEPVLDSELVRVAEPWTKWAYEVQRAQDIPQAVRRAVQVARTPPTGPVFLSLPIDVQMEPIDNADLSAPLRLDARLRPSSDAVESATAILRTAKRPAILAGSRVNECHGETALMTLAETLGAPIFIEGTATHGRLPASARHPLYHGVISHWSSQIHEVLRSFDSLFVVGANLFRLYIHQQPDWPLEPTMKVVHCDVNPWQIGKNAPPAVGVLGDIAMSLAEIVERLASSQSTSEKSAAQARVGEWSRRRVDDQAALRAKISAVVNNQPMHPLAFMDALAQALPEDGAVVEEAITTHHNVLERLGVLGDSKGFFAHRGWALGWGVGCALGVKLAWPDRPVLGLIGDGSALYGIQGLWTAARHQIPVTFVIPNNSQYKILKICGDVLNLPELSQPGCPGININEPHVDYVGLARSFGVEAARIDKASELTAAVKSSLAGDKPQLIEVPIAE